MNAGDLIAGKYRLTKPIGKGSMGTVWEAIHEGTSRPVAVKLILEPTDELRHRLVREARAYGALRHRNIVEILDVGQTDDGDPFLVMQLLVGETLAERLTRQRRLAVPEATRIARDVARALAAAHASSIIHRDLKPANIFLHDEPDEDATVIKVVDFGVSKNLQDSDGLTTVAGGMVGSPAYMSPEQASGGMRGPVDPRADIWSLGVVLFEMLTGVRPLQGDANTILVQIMTAEIPLVTTLVRKVDPKLAALVARCLERDLAKRFGSAADLAAQLQIFTTANLGSGSSPLGQSGSAFTPPPAPASRSDSAVLASPRAAFASVPERDPSVRSPRMQGGLLAAGPTMPGADDDGDDEATAKLTPGILHALRPPAPAAPPRMSPRAGATVPIEREPAPSSPYSGAAPDQNESVPAPPSFKPTFPSQNAPSFGSGPAWTGPAPTTAKLDPSPAWADPMVTKHGTMRMSPDTVDLIRKRAADREQMAPPPAPPPPAAATGLSAVSSTAPFLQQSGGDPSSTSQAAALKRRRRVSGIIVGSVVGVALAILVMVLLRARTPGGAAQSAPESSASAMGITSAAPAASAQTPSAAPEETAAPIAPATPSAAPGASVAPSASGATPPPIAKAPSGIPTSGKRASGVTSAPTTKSGPKPPTYPWGAKKFDPTRP